jgi:hypothetical protein
MALTLTLEQTMLNNVNDVAGRWQFEGVGYSKRSAT